MKEKENALNDFVVAMRKSWTYARLTEEEKQRFELAFSDLRVSNCLRGSYKQRWDILNAVYATFLYGIGYKNEWNWRENFTKANEEDLPF